MKEKSKQNQQSLWQQKYPFALANYLWMSPSGRKICVARELTQWSAVDAKKYSKLDGESRFCFDAVSKWESLIGAIRDQRYPIKQIEACDIFSQIVFENVWNEKNEYELLQIFFATWCFIESEKVIGDFQNIDFDLFMTFSFRASLIFILELTFGAKSFDVALESSRAYLELSQALNEQKYDYSLTYSLKNFETPSHDKDHPFFKKLSSKENGDWNELSRANIFFYAMNFVNLPTSYPAGSVSLRILLLKALEMSGLPSPEAFIESFEKCWVFEEANVS